MLAAFLSVFGLALVGVAALPGKSLAGDWTYTLQVTEEVLFDDNISLEKDPAGYVFGNKITPKLTITSATPTLKVGLDVKLDHEVFSGPGADGTLKRLNKDVSLSGTKSWSRTSLTVSGRLAREATRDTELEDTGVTTTDATRKTDSIRTVVSQRISRRDSVNLSGEVSNVDFDGGGTFTPSKTYNVDTGWTHQLTEQDNIGVSFGVSFFMPEGSSTDDDSKTYRISANHSRQHTPRFSTSGAIGVTISPSDGTSGSSDSGSLGFRIDSGLVYSWVDTTLTLDLNQDVTPSSEGDLRQNRSLSFGLAHRFNREVNLGLSAKYFSRLKEVSFISLGDSERDFFSVEPSLSWRLTPNVSFSLRYRLRYEDDVDSGTALSNAVFVGFTVNDQILR